LLIWDQSHHKLGANPQNFLILTTGMMALIFFDFDDGRDAVCEKFSV